MSYFIACYCHTDTFEIKQCPSTSGAVVKVEVGERMSANLILAALNHNALQSRFSNEMYYLLHQPVA